MMAKQTDKKSLVKTAALRAAAKRTTRRVRTEVVPHVPAADVPALVESFHADRAIDVSVVPEGGGLFTVIAAFPA